MGKATNLGLSFEKLVAESSRDKDRNNGAVGYLHYHDTGTCPRIYEYVKDSKSCLSASEMAGISVCNKRKMVTFKYILGR